MPKSFVLYCMGVLSGQICSCLAKKLCFIVLFVIKTRLVLNLTWVCFSYYLYLKASLEYYFITKLPLCDGNNAFFTFIDRLMRYCWFLLYSVGDGDLSASSVAKLFFDNVVRFFGIPVEVILDRDPRFTACFW